MAKQEETRFSLCIAKISQGFRNHSENFAILARRVASLVLGLLQVVLML